MFALRLLSEGAEGPNLELVWLLYTGIAFFFAVIVIGWLASRNKVTEPEIHHETKEHEADDLAKIEGIGPKVVKVLARVGVSTYEELAHANAREIQKALNAAGLQMMNPEGWIEQAKLAAKGDWKGFDKLQKELKGGRRK